VHEGVLLCTLLIASVVALNAPPANAHTFVNSDTAVSWGSCQADHFSAYNFFGSGNHDSKTINSNCWSTYSRVVTFWGGYWEASGNPVDSSVSVSGHYYSSWHTVCYGLFNCAGVWVQVVV
jgi:hypothetical protein